MVFYNKNGTYLTVISQSNMGKMSIFTLVSPYRRPKVSRSIVQTTIFVSENFSMYLKIYIIYICILLFLLLSILVRIYQRRHFHYNC